LNSTCLDLPFAFPLLLVVEEEAILGNDVEVETLRVRRRVAGGEALVLVDGKVDDGDRVEERL
jgi:hypothetical protein